MGRPTLCQDRRGARHERSAGEICAVAAAMGCGGPRNPRLEPAKAGVSMNVPLETPAPRQLLVRQSRSALSTFLSLNLFSRQLDDPLLRKRRDRMRRRLPHR